MSRTILDIHVLQTVPPSNLNRDDTGSPKTAYFGGTQRARVSSQAWKRATRLNFDQVLDDSQLGVRTKRVAEILSSRLQDLVGGKDELPEEEATKLASQALTAAGYKLVKPKANKKDDEKGPKHEESAYLLFLSNAQYDALASLALEAHSAGNAIDKKAAKAAANEKHSVGIALFGRMIADDPGLNVDAACQVAHALSVHPVETEFDYFTAVDDRKYKESETGAGMIGTVEFNSATLYRYAALDINRLRENLGDNQATIDAAATFLRAFVTSMPTGKQNTFANRTVPDAILVHLREDQPINLVGAFEEPVQTNEGRVKAAADALAKHVGYVEETGFTKPPVETWNVAVGPNAEGIQGLGINSSFGELVTNVETTIASRLE